VRRKFCNKCQAKKPITDFARNKRTPDGKQAHCKVCNKKYRDANEDKISEYRTQYREIHKDKYREYARIYYQENKKKLQAQCKEYRNDPEIKKRRLAREIQKRYGISLQEYEELKAIQNNKCAICGGVQTKGKRWCIDHCHETGEVRGLLCDGCNLGLGLMGDNKEGLLRALAYLENVA
jgi:hypothetical protein